MTNKINFIFSNYTTITFNFYFNLISICSKSSEGVDFLLFGVLVIPGVLLGLVSNPSLGVAFGTVRLLLPPTIFKLFISIPLRVIFSHERSSVLAILPTFSINFNLPLTSILFSP